MLGTIALIVIALLVLSLLVVVHEFGHFIAAKLMGVWPEEFGIGLPPRVWGKKIGNTIWSINALPLGGFVRLHGETAENGVSKPEMAYANKSKLARAFIAVAGVAMNVLFAILAFSFIFFMLGIPQGVTVDSVTPESPAEAIGLQEGDTIISVDGRMLYNPSFFSQKVVSHAGKSIEISYKSIETGELVTKSFVLRPIAPENQGLLGITYKPTAAGALETPGISRLTSSIQYGAYETYDFTVLILSEFGKMIRTATQGHVPVGLTGPIGVVGVTAQAASQGIFDLIGLSALISLNLALINIVPFPPLDGSRILFLIIEAIVGKKRTPKIEEKVQMVGFYALLVLVAFLTFRELPKLITAGSLDRFVQSLIQ